MLASRFDQSAPRYRPGVGKKSPLLADTDYVAGYRTALSRFGRVIQHPATEGMEREAIAMLMAGHSPDRIIAEFDQMAPVR